MTIREKQAGHKPGAEKGRDNMEDLERSTYQRRPAYRYIRAGDKLPVVAPEEPQAIIKLFNPTGSWSWYIAAYDPATRQAYGLVKGFEREVGYFDMAELVAFRGRFGLPIERDLSFRPTKLVEVK